MQVILNQIPEQLHPLEAKGRRLEVEQAEVAEIVVVSDFLQATEARGFWKPRVFAVLRLHVVVPEVELLGLLLHVAKHRENFLEVAARALREEPLERDDLMVGLE